MVDRLTQDRGNPMIPSSMLGGLVLLTSLAAPEADQNQKRDEVRIELLGCIISSALKVQLRRKLCVAKFSAAAGHSCQLARRPTDATPPRSQKQPRLRFAYSKSAPGARKAVAIRQPTRSRPHFAALKIWRSITAVLIVGNPSPEGRN